ncbi:regulatory LuxR family protein [Kribbella steppae]|uniref:Regulatory LuxR family protein n=2 Tax=Kribbella steppae TaxID=2512223 RepID=A0A4R2GZJ5_9ACTN|nr:regulatory LuxR family protein [Kribbella steppae]
MPGFKGFSPKIAEIVRNADRTIRYVAPGEHRRLYNQWRVTMGTIGPVDSFYIGFFRDEQYLVIPYMFDELEEYEPPGFQMYGQEGLATWIKNHAKPYIYSMDSGKLLNKGHSFGDEERLSGDAIAIPLLQSPPDRSVVIGIASMQTYRSNVYTEETVQAFQVLARSVVTALQREREDLARQSTLFTDGPLGAKSMISVVDIIEDFGHKLERLRNKIDHLLKGELSNPELIRHELTALRDLCERAQGETTELFMVPSLDSQTLLDKLTPREREIAELIRNDLTNEEIALRLAISEPTVKTHVTRILRKFSVRQRSAVAAKLRPFG